MSVHFFKCLVFSFVIVTHIASQFTFNGISTRIADTEIIEIFDFSLVMHNGVKKLNGTYAQHTVLQILEVDLTIDFQYTRNKGTRFLDMTLDVCRFFEGKYDNNQLFKHIRKSLTKSKTFQQKCPLPAHHMFKVELLDLAPLSAGFLPNLTFFATLKLHEKGHLYAQLDLNGFSKMK